MKWTMVFEDYEGSALPQYYRKYYTNIEEELVWTGGNGEVRNRVLQRPLLDGFDIVFMDVNPWSKQLFQIFNKMCNWVRRSGWHYIVIPVVCSEYNYLQSLPSAYMKDKLVLLKLAAVREEHNFTFEGITTYEGYCKWCAKYLVKENASVDENIALPSNHFIRNAEVSDWCRFVEQYGACPIQKGVMDGNSVLSVEEVCTYQNKVVDMFNEWAASVVTSHTIKLRKILPEYFK